MDMQIQRCSLPLYENRDLRTLHTLNFVANFKKTMRVTYKAYSIDIIDDKTYTLNSVDNLVAYQLVYFEGEGYEDRFYPTSKHGIRVSLDNIEISSAIICEIGGATTIHENSFVINNDSIFICCCDKVYSLGLPNLDLKWIKRFDPATCFGIYEFGNDFIIHGELQISKINKKGELKWDFGARDIFVLQNGGKAMTIDNDMIYLKDWEGYEYILDSNGKEIK